MLFNCYFILYLQSVKFGRRPKDKESSKLKGENIFLESEGEKNLLWLKHIERLQGKLILVFQSLSNFHWGEWWCLNNISVNNLDLIWDQSLLLIQR